MTHPVRLADLKHLPRPWGSPEDLSTFEACCREMGLDWPQSVIEQFLYDHGNDADFIEQYGELDLSALRWDLVEVRAENIIASTCYPDYRDHVEETARHPRAIIEQHEEDGESVWTVTWRVPPVMLRGAICIPPQPELHLVEGHTRVGVLSGLVRVGEIDPDSTHLVYLGSARPEIP